MTPNEETQINLKIWVNFIFIINKIIYTK